VEDVAGAIGVDDLLVRDIERRQEALGFALIVPDHAARAHCNCADAAAARTQISQHLARRQLHLLAQPLRNDGSADECQEVVRVGAQAATVKRREDAGLMTDLGIVNRRIGKMPVDMERAAAGQVQHWKRMLEAVIPASHDRALSTFRHDERQRGLRHLAMVHGDSVFRRHVDEHAAEPVICDRGHQIRCHPELGAAECCRHRVAAEGDGVVARHRLVIAGREFVGQECDVDVALPDKE